MLVVLCIEIQFVQELEVCMQVFQNGNVCDCADSSTLCVSVCL